MANIGPGKGYAKKDLNFFAQFTAKARQQARALAIVVLVALVVVGIFVIWTLISLVKNLTVSSKVNELTLELQDPKYANLDIEARNLEQQIIERNQYFYSISEMRKFVDETNTAKTQLADLLGESIPNDTFISKYEITGTDMTIEGYTFNYYEAANIGNMLQDHDVFSNYNIQVTHEPKATESGDEEIMGINTVYSFQISGSLTVDSYISISRVIDTGSGLTAIGGVVTTAYTTGSTYEFPDIVSVEVNGATYQLSSILIDGNLVSEDEFNAIVANNSISGRAAGNMSIELHYAAVVVAEGGEE
ncbi:MAG: PilN domain-containing protein [Saccharofermentans sp.]|nr:PilN domain-containing protein [Saccharofermentans sp.]